MVKIRTVILSTALLTVAPLSFGFDWGGSLHNNSKYEGNKIKKLSTDQRDSASLWFRVPLTDVNSDSGNASLTVRGSYEYNYDNTFEGRDRFINTLDVDLCCLSYSSSIKNTFFSVQAGRFFYSDLSSVVFSQVADGAAATLKFPSVELSAYGAYTGLLNMHTTSLLDADSKDYKPRHLYQLQSKYAVFGATLSVPHMIFNQGFALHGFGAVKLEKKNLRRFYGTAAFSCSLIPRTYYNFSTTFAFKSYDCEKYKISNLTQIKLSVYPNFKSAYLALNGVYASGGNGKLDPFVGFTSAEAVKNLESKEYTGLIKGGAEASVKIIEPVALFASADAIINAEENHLKYDGFQYTAKCGIQISSDLSLEGSFSRYRHKKNKDLNNTVIQLKGTFTF